MKRLWFGVVLLALTLTLGAVIRWQSEDPFEKAVASITADDIRHRIGIIAHDSMGGRHTPSQGLDRTADYIAGQFRGLGLKPGGDDGSFIQRYELSVIQLDAPNSSIELEGGEGGGGGPTLRFGRDAAYWLGRLGPEIVSGPPIVVTGNASSLEQLAGLPLLGAIVIYVARMSADGVLDAATRQTFSNLYRQRPSALLVVADYPDAMWTLVVDQPPPTRLIIEGETPEGRLIVFVREQAISGFLAKQGVSAAPASGPGSELDVRTLSDVNVTLRTARDVVAKRSAPNVVGILEGSDSTLRDEYVVFSAHMDHIGSAGESLSTCEAVDGDAICNGADDDASGTAAVLEAAQAFAGLSPRPRRSLIFLAVSGEEQGLLGSLYFAKNPPVPLDRFVANLNIDMIGRNWRDTIAVIGKEHSDLGSTVERIAESHPELDMVPIDDIWPGQRFYSRSDHYNFARRGVPILFFFNGVHDDYHQPSDEVEKIDAEKASRIVKLMFYLGLEVANSDARPQWNPASYDEIVDESLVASPD